MFAAVRLAFGLKAGFNAEKSWGKLGSLRKRFYHRAECRTKERTFTRYCLAQFSLISDISCALESEPRPKGRGVEGVVKSSSQIVLANHSCGIASSHGKLGNASVKTLKASSLNEEESHMHCCFRASKSSEDCAHWVSYAVASFKLVVNTPFSRISLFQRTSSLTP